MSEAGGNENNESPKTAKASAPKDRNCPYCGQAFTSSSLGRHLDLYIKEKNPKPPDGVHDVEEIRKMRGTITRRMPRGSSARRESSNNVSTPSTPAASAEPALKRTAIPKEGHYVVDQAQAAKVPLFQTPWEATGVINDIPTRNGDDDQRSQRLPSRMAQKQQLDARQKLADAMDTARAAELALRELLSSFRAAKHQIDMNSLPFDFDPLALDFPTLTLQCLQPPPTLFSSTPHPTSTSWSIQPPAQKQFEALKAYFQEEFRKWKVACAATTTASTEELTYPPSNSYLPADIREGVKKAEKAAATLEKNVNEHLQSTYQVWEQLSPQRKTELWTLELARGVGRRQKDLDALKQTQDQTKQENKNLKSHIDQLNRLQQPREFCMMPPATVKFDQELVDYCLDLSHRGFKAVGLHHDDRHADLTTVVSRAIERWKNVIVSSRSNGMSAQRPLDQPATATNATNTTAAVFTPRSTQLKPLPLPAPSSGLSNDSRSTTTAATSASIVNDGNSDQDADAEMEDDSFAPISTPTVAKPLQQQSQQPLEVPRTRGHVPPRQPVKNDAGARFVNGTGNMANNRMSMSRSMPNMNATTRQVQQQQHHQQPRGGGMEYATAAQGVTGGGDPMYMD